MSKDKQDAPARYKVLIPCRDGKSFTAADRLLYLCQYKVLIPCRDDKSGQSWKRGDIITAGDLPASVLLDWTRIDPPVLKRIEEADSGGKS